SDSEMATAQRTARAGPSKVRFLALHQSPCESLVRFISQRAAESGAFAGSPARFPVVADKQVLYLTTIGRRTGLPREIEIWFVIDHGRFYLFAETGDDAAWVKNIRRNREVGVRVRDRQICATARVLDSGTDRGLWDRVSEIANRRYGSGEGLTVEINPAPQSAGSPH